MSKKYHRPLDTGSQHTSITSINRWVKKDKEWVRRKKLRRGQRSSYIGRMRFVTPTPESMPTFYLRMLLNVVKGPRSFEDFRRVDGVLHPTYKMACFALGLIEDDSEWDQALREAAMSKSAKRMRQLFVIILTACFPLQPQQLWRDHCVSMSEDFAHRRGGTGATVLPCDINQALLDIEKRLHDFPVSSLGSYGLESPAPTGEDETVRCREVQDALDFDITGERILAVKIKDSLNHEQRIVFEKIDTSAASDVGGFFYHGMWRFRDW